MDYILLSVPLLGTLILGLWLRHYYLKNNYDKYIDLTASLLLAKDRYHRSRLQGSIIFELQKYHESLTDVQITNIKTMDNGTLVKDFDRLHFELGREGRLRSALSSVSVLTTERAVRRYQQNRDTVYIAGTLRFADRTKKSFAKKMNVGMADKRLKVAATTIV